MKKRFLFPLIAAGAIVGLGVLGSNINATCVPGNADYEAGTGICNAKNRAADEASSKTDAEAARKVQAESQARAAIAEAQAKADAKFAAEGWFQLQPGVYGRWCTETCSKASVIGDSAYWLLEVWAKDRAAGDIYARINVMKDGVVVGWTNDTAYLSQGQRGVMTFSKHLPGSGGQYTAQITEFNARG